MGKTRIDLLKPKYYCGKCQGYHYSGRKFKEHKQFKIPFEKIPKDKKHDQDLILKHVKQVINNYKGGRLTVRQIFYRLVSKNIIENTRGKYSNTAEVLIAARKQKIIPYSAIEDRSREIIEKHKIRRFFSPKEEIDYLVNSIKDPDPYELPNNLFQNKILVIGLEKQALQGIFADIIDNFKNTILIVGKGYNSLSQLYDLWNAVNKENREIHIKFFSDFDPDGKQIQESFLENIEHLGIQYHSFERIALTEKQIREYSLPHNPTKETKRSKNWNYNFSVELDALDPIILRRMIEDTCKEYWDYEMEQKVNHLEEIMNRRYLKNLKKIAHYLP